MEFKSMNVQPEAHVGSGEDRYAIANYLAASQQAVARRGRNRRSVSSRTKTTKGGDHGA